MTVRIAVRVHPGARRGRLQGRLADGTYKFEVQAPAEDGRANRAVCELIAQLLGVKPQQVTVVRGQSARMKQVEITGVEPQAVADRLDAELESQESRGD